MVGLRVIGMPGCLHHGVVQTASTIGVQYRASAGQSQAGKQDPYQQEPCHCEPQPVVDGVCQQDCTDAAYDEKTRDGVQARRLLTLASIYEGSSRTEAAAIGIVMVQIARD